jgi:DNA helicase-2/ATP-dependent DNA helicase PcrA
MRVIADLEVHSKYARAVSKDMVVPVMVGWAKKKGITLLGTGDFTHPFWISELKKQLVEAEDGLYKLKDSEDPIRFILTAEVSSIYSQSGKTRRIHTILVAPSFEAAEQINRELTRRGANLYSDGRPVMGLTAKDIAAIALAADDRVMVIPAHIWTPWFSLFGSMSGFDSIKECFGDIAGKIAAVETGLSSDPPMNWRLSQLDPYAIVSFSDAHSPANLMREATVFEIEKLDYDHLRKALVSPDEKNKIAYTIEFFPEEGKYHFDGHRGHKIRLHPKETKEKEGLCPVCHRPVTVGVLNRVEQLADRPEGFEDPKRPPYKRMVQLDQIIAESMGVGTASKQVTAEYERLLSDFGSEFVILTEASSEDLSKRANSKLVDGINRVREGKIHIEPGYDGEYGVVKVFADEKEATSAGQESLF